MLQEIKRVRQTEETGRRRWFSDDFFDLIVWYDDRDSLLGFQLCYDLRGDQRVLTWHRRRGYSHDRVDDGEQVPQRDMTPILVADGLFARDSIITRFKERVGDIDRTVAELVVARLEAYDGPLKL